MKRIPIIIVVAVVAIGLLSSVFVFDPFHLNLNLFHKELSIGNTANVITGINKVSEFTTSCFFEEKIIIKEKYRHIDRKVYNKDAVKEDLNSIKGSSVKNLASNTVSALKNIATADEVVVDSTLSATIVFLVKTKVRAGYNLSKIEENHLSIYGDTLEVKIPEVEIFDIITNPSDWTIYHREGRWDDGEIRNIQSGAKEGIRQDALDCGILNKAESAGKDELVSLFKSFGFGTVIINN